MWNRLSHMYIVVLIGLQGSKSMTSFFSLRSTAQQRLKLYNKCPPNGLAIFSGDIVGYDGCFNRLAIDT